MKKIAALLACLALGACQDATDFRKGDRTDATVQLTQDRCVVWVSVASQNTEADVGIYARIISKECN